MPSVSPYDPSIPFQENVNRTLDPSPGNSLYTLPALCTTIICLAGAILLISGLSLRGDPTNLTNSARQIFVGGTLAAICLPISLIFCRCAYQDSPQ